MSQIVFGNDTVVGEMLQALGLKDVPVAEFSLHISLDEPVTLNVTRLVNEEEFKQIVQVLERHNLKSVNCQYNLVGD